MANEENLIPKPFKSGEEAKRMGKKGGSARTPRKKYSARLRELKKKGLQNVTIRRITDIMEDPECSVLDIKLFLDSLRIEAKKDPDLSIKLVNAYIKLHMAHHGQKHKIQGELSHNILPLKINIIYPKENENNARTGNKLETDKKASNGTKNPK